MIAATAASDAAIADVESSERPQSRRKSKRLKEASFDKHDDEEELTLQPKPSKQRKQAPQPQSSTRTRTAKRAEVRNCICSGATRIVFDESRAHSMACCGALDS